MVKTISEESNISIAKLKYAQDKNVLIIKYFIIIILTYLVNRDFISFHTI